ncbi:unnamed protein product [Cyprideis torosa]|uniref:Uncharacterized protein n=1 Tax=Cyprideis torosa TaxID=163714 RepID=A0A7R8ZP97_9CRUS|nr:unnamed protein product [Cyprideis torosa]CAG0898277.1 unnamed protein product [Cyprideis torosa]
MGKIKNKRLLKAGRHKPLEIQILDEDAVKPSTREKDRPSSEENEVSSKVVPPSLSANILKSAKAQQAEEAGEDGVFKKPEKPSLKTIRLDTEDWPSLSSKGGPMAGDSEDDDEAELSVERRKYNECQFEESIDKEDEEALEKFMNPNAPTRKTLADFIMEKIKEKETEVQSQLSETAGSVVPVVEDLDPRILEMYDEVRKVLSSYRSGKLPKACHFLRSFECILQAFKLIPRLVNWEQILYITRPEMWTAAAMYQATRIFVSNLKEKMAQRFFALVLLPRIRDDIQEYKRLNFHLYQALRKALFKPGAFMKGILLPLCESGTCTLREAIIVGSVLAKNSIPVLHSSAAMLKLAELNYSGANSVFLRIFFDKRYALPFRVIDAVVFHFIRFRSDPRDLPVLWHQCLLTFVQRYKEDISSEQKEALMDLLKVKSHSTITPEVRRELAVAEPRDEEMAVDV